MSKKKKILICIAAVLAVLLFLDCMVYPKTPPIEEWKQVAVHTSESGYWPPTDSKLPVLFSVTTSSASSLTLNPAQ